MCYLAIADICLTELVQDQLCHLFHTKIVYWKQCGKIKGIQAGDENTRFFHTHASQKMRRNNIRALGINGAQVLQHEAKKVAPHILFQHTRHLKQLCMGFSS